MSQNDNLRNFLFENMPVRGTIATLKTSFQVINEQHHYAKPIQKILGEMLVAVSLLSASIKFKGRLTIQFQGKGQLKLLMVQFHNGKQLRGLAQCNGDISETELHQELRQGTLGIIIDSSAENGPGSRYEGIVDWDGDSFVRSIENYFKRSEQIPTRLWLAVDQDKAAGMLVQIMPKEAAEPGKNTLSDHDWEHVVHLTSTVTRKELLELSPEQLLRRLYIGEQVRIFEPVQLEFGCTCSLKRSEAALKMLGQIEVEEELKAKQKIIVTCEFCNREFTFDKKQVAAIFNQPNGSDLLH